MSLQRVVTLEEAIKVVIKDSEGNPEPEVYYYLPSGYKDKAIRVYESAYEGLEVKLVPKLEIEAEKRKLMI